MNEALSTTSILMSRTVRAGDCLVVGALEVRNPGSQSLNHLFAECSYIPALKVGTEPPILSN